MNRNTSLSFWGKINTLSTNPGLLVLLCEQPCSTVWHMFFSCFRQTDNYNLTHLKFFWSDVKAWLAFLSFLLVINPLHIAWMVVADLWSLCGKGKMIIFDIQSGWNGFLSFFLFLFGILCGTRKYTLVEIVLLKLYLLLLFQIILRHENSEPCITQLRVQFTHKLSAFQVRNVVVLWITDWKWCSILPDILTTTVVDMGWLRSNNNLFSFCTQSFIFQLLHLYTFVRDFNTPAKWWYQIWNCVLCCHSFHAWENNVISVEYKR